MTRLALESLLRPGAVRLNILTIGAGVLLIVVGLFGQTTTYWAAGGILIVLAVANWPKRARVAPRPMEDRRPEEQREATRPQPACDSPGAIDPGDTRGLVAQMLSQHRYALLLRPQIVANLDEQQFAGVLETLQDRMALVPDGEVTLGPVDEAPEDEAPGGEASCSGRQHTARVRRFFLDRYPVTNRQYFEFVAAGGYQQMSLWDESVLPAVLEFVDRTSQPGPRFWKKGCFLEGTEDHPVVGVCWHEAVAYSRWVGKRLPSDAEWVKAGAWPIPMTDHGRVQRKYPWGDEMEHGRANLWGSGPGHVVGVHEFADGISVGGVHQLIGNVWEWTSGNFQGGDHALGTLTFKTPMKSIRGGAFDTYFDNQATCQFVSGESTLARKRNIGFRLAIGVCDLVLDYSAARPAADVHRPEAPVRDAAEHDAVWPGSVCEELGHDDTTHGDEVPA